MASTLRSKAIKNVTKGNTSAYYSYLEEKNGSNPVIQQFEKELSDYMGFVKKKNAGLLKPGEHPPCKVSDAIFNIWNKFEPRVSKRFFYEKLMQMGDHLALNKEHSVAAWQCYDRYLITFYEGQPEKISNADDLKSLFFSEGIENPNSDITFRALMGHCICRFHTAIAFDMKLQKPDTPVYIIQILKFLRLIMQLLLEKDHFCWLVYNGTIYTYTIVRHMMQFGQSKNMLEFLLFSCLAIETSIPLLGIKYLSWRATLYATTCQCFYDCKYSDDGEMFARRALSKINELHELELASINGESGTQAPQFREATIKIGVMLFRRLVFEARRKVKGLIRPKIRINYKELHSQQWPRTNVERLLNEMFDCSSAQFLAIEEALNDTNRRIGVPSPAANDLEFEMLDAALELLFAAECLVNGGGGKQPISPKEISDFKGLVVDDKSLISMAIAGTNGVQARNFLRVIKLAFSYEAWEIFRKLSIKTLSHFELLPELKEKYKSELHFIELLLAYEKYLGHLRKLKQIKNEVVKANVAAAKTGKTPSIAIARPEVGTNKLSIAHQASKTPNSNLLMRGLNEIKESDDQIEILPSPSQSEVTKEEDLLASMAHVLLKIIDSKIQPEQCDWDVSIDVTLLLWKKCKEVFQKHQNGAHDNFRWVTKMDNFPKWFFILNVTHESMCHFQIANIDPIVYAHCSLRLGLIYDSLANVLTKKPSKAESSSALDIVDDQYSMSKTFTTKFSLIELSQDIVDRYCASNDVRTCLTKAKSILKKSIDGVSKGRLSLSKENKTFICDRNYDDENLKATIDITTTASTNPTKVERLKALKERTFKYTNEKQETEPISSTFISDLHVELIFLYHKVSIRLLELKDGNRSVKEDKDEATIEKEFELLLNGCKNNKVSQSLLYLARALSLNGPNESAKRKSDKKILAEKAYNKLLKAEEYDKMLYDKHVKQDATVSLIRCKVPPPPIIRSITSNQIVVQPRIFESVDEIKPHWYAVYANPTTKINSKARISDYLNPGCGEQILASSCERITINGLTPDENYAFAVAAFDKNGVLIGDSIGESTEPILASCTLSLLMNWSFLCQVSYQIGEYDLALKAFQVLWDYFVIKPLKPETETFISKNETDYEITFHQLNYNIIEKSSTILLRKFLECFFIISDLQVKRKKIYCDLLFDGKIQFEKQIERVQECEKLLVAIELAAWLNDNQTIMQAIVQCYGLVAPLIYFNLDYEPVVKILSHCLLILEDLPLTQFQRKSKNMFESIQHMIACSTYYLTDILKKSNKRTLSNFFNLIGRKLLGVEDEDKDEQEADDKQMKLRKKDEKVITNAKLNELKALESYIAKTNVNVNRNYYFNMLTGNEDAAQIYAYILQNVTKLTYKEIIKFRKRTNYLEYLTILLQKALNEELNYDVNDWAMETVDWIQKRNISILGPYMITNKKHDAFMNVANKAYANQDFDMEAHNVQLKKKSLKKKAKKYKLLIPLDLDMGEKMRLEEKQKHAIEVLLDKFADLFDHMIRKRKIRKQFLEESAYKSQFFALWALNDFYTLMNRIQLSNANSTNNFENQINTSSYLDAQIFLFDKNIALLVSKDSANRNANNSSQAIQKRKSETTNLSKSTELLTSKSNGLTKSNTTRRSETYNEEKMFADGNNKDTCDIVAELMSAYDTTNFNFKETEKRNMENNHDHQQQAVTQNLTSLEFIELTSNLFNKFKYATVIAHRGKQWTQLQNTCKLMFNCINSFLVRLPAVSSNHRKIYKMKDLWKSLCPSIYIAAENLLDMLFYASPIEKNVIKDMQNKVNKWFDSPNVGKIGGSLKFDVPLDDITSIDLRFIREFIYRAIQCMSIFEKWEKLLSIGLKFNVMTSYKYAEEISPVIIFAQNKLLKQIAKCGGIKSQTHFERLKAELGRYPRVEDLFFINFKIEIDPTRLEKVDVGVKIDPRLHDIYKNNNRSKELISVSLDVNESLKALKNSLENSLYTSRALLHARRLLSLYLLSQTNLTEFFDLENNNEIEFDNKKSKMSNMDKSDRHETGRVEFETKSFMEKETKPNASMKYSQFFHSNPINYYKKTFEDEDEVFINKIDVDLATVIESYTKSIQLLLSQNEKDLAVQAIHELGNIYHFSKDINQAYAYWNEALDRLMGVKDSLIRWRNEFTNKETNSVETSKILKECGIWGCMLGGVLAAKMAQYFLAKDLELRTECCLLSATFFKCIFRSSVSFSKHDIDYIRHDYDYLNSDFLVPGFLFNNEIFRFDVKYVIASLNYVCLELLNAGHYLYMMPSVTLYEYFSRNLARSSKHSVFAKLIKIESLIKLNFFTEAITSIISLGRGDYIPHFIDEKPRVINYSKYNEFLWNSSKPIYDPTNLKSLESILFLKLTNDVIKCIGSHLTCRFFIVQCKLFVQLASCLPCLPSFNEFNNSQLYSFHNYTVSEDRTKEQVKHERNNATSFSINSKKIKEPHPNLEEALEFEELESDPNIIKIFTNSTTPLTIEHLKGCLLGTAKTILVKCLKNFDEDFPTVEKYSVSGNWQREFKYESNMLLAAIADQSQLGYISLQNIIEAMKELTDDENSGIDPNESKKSLISVLKKQKQFNFVKRAPKTSSKKGIYQVFDLICEAHLSSRLWLKARMIFVQYMFNQLNDAGKAKGNDDNIIRDFGDLKYYCEKSLAEAEKYYDLEAKAFFKFIDVSLDVLRGIDLNACMEKLQSCLLDFLGSRQLSFEGVINYLKAIILKNDIGYAIDLINAADKELSQSSTDLYSLFNKSIESLLKVQRHVLEYLKINGGEHIEFYVDISKSYFDNIAGDIKNIFNPLYHYLVHLKLRLGSLLILKSSYLNNSQNSKDLEPSELKKAPSYWQHALNVISSGLELNKTICERSLCLEIELSYKYAHCVRELFMTSQLTTLNDVVEAYGNTIMLAHYSTHDLNILKNCYLELAIAFVTTYDLNIIAESRDQLTTQMPMTPITMFQSSHSVSSISSTSFTSKPAISTSSKGKKITTQMLKAIEAALTALAYAVKTTNAMKEKMLLPGHKEFKSMDSIIAPKSPCFVASDLLGYYVLAERRRIYRDEIEEEVLKLAPEFEEKIPLKSYDEKVKTLSDESNKSITWIHLLNYQSKLQNLNSMINMNTLRNGKNRHKYSSLYTIGFTPIFKSTYIMASRLFELNNYLKINLDIYKAECQAPTPIVDFFKFYARKAVVQNSKTPTASNIRPLLKYVKFFEGNMANFKTETDQETEAVDGVTTPSSTLTKPANVKQDWTYLQMWPTNWKQTHSATRIKITDNTTSESFVDYVLTFNWFKELVVSHENLQTTDDNVTAIIAVRDSLTSNKLKFKNLSAEKVHEIHDKLAPLATIADTTLDTKAKNNENEINTEFMNSLRSCLSLIDNLFDKKSDKEKKIPFDLKPSNIVDLERMFNLNFGSYTNNESLKNYILNLFI